MHARASHPRLKKRLALRIAGMAQSTYVYVGAYTTTSSRGIAAFRRDAAGQLTAIGEFEGAGSPSFLALHPTRRVLYAVHELDNYQGKSQGAISAYAIDDASGALSFLNAVPTGGAHPCHVSIERSGRYAFVANYTGGSVAMYRLDAQGGIAAQCDFHQHAGTGNNPERQDSAHAHQVLVDPTNRLLHVCDLGLDQIVHYIIDTGAGRLRPAGYTRTAAGAGPRHMAFHPSGRFAYAINELDSTLNAYAVSGGGALTELQSLSTLPAGFAETNYCADVHVSSDGRFVYGSNRGHDSLAIFEIDPNSGLLTARGHAATGGHWPRNFALAPDGASVLVANQESEDIHVLSRNARTGALGKAVRLLKTGKPVCVLFCP